MKNSNHSSPFEGEAGRGSALPRGIRNCNPLNIRHSASKWQGMRETQTDPDFVQFRTMAYGYRAALCLIRTYRRKYHLTTLRKIVNRWAPSWENDSAMYLRMVQVLTGLTADYEFQSDTDPHLLDLLAAMSRVENGVPANRTELQAGWALYLG